MIFPKRPSRGFRKRKRTGYQKSALQTASGAEILIAVVGVVHANAGRGSILYTCTQRVRESKISIVGIDKVKVRSLPLSLDHVSHFFQNQNYGPTSNRRIFVETRFEILHLSALLPSLPPRVAL